MPKRAVLVTGCGGPAAIGFTRSLARTGRYRTVGTDSNLFALPFAETDASHLVPPASSDEYLPVLRQVVDDESVQLVHAQPDPEVFALSLHRDAIPASLFLPRHQTVLLCQDKYASYLRWEAAGLPVPRTILLRSPDDLAAAVADLSPPFWVRARRGAGGKGSLVARDHDATKAWVDLHRGWGQFTASALLPGRLLTWQSLWRGGELVVAQSRERLSWSMGGATMSGVSGMTGVARTVRRRDLDAIAEAAVRSIDDHPEGLFGVDLKENVAGEPCPTEINVGRFFTTIEFFTELGLNLPDIYVSLALGDQSRAPDQTYNPLPLDWYWLRAADSLPRLMHADELIRRYAGRVDVSGLLQADGTVTYGDR